jgi:hypothetical protein
MSAAKSAVQSTTKPARHWYFREAPELPEKWRSPLAQDKLLDEYLVHYGSIAAFANARGLTVDQMYDWLHSEPVVERRRRLEEMANDRADLVAKLNRPAALERLAEIANNIHDIHPRERRLAASAIIRHTQAADRRACHHPARPGDADAPRSEPAAPAKPESDNHPQPAPARAPHLKPPAPSRGHPSPSHPLPVSSALTSTQPRTRSGSTRSLPRSRPAA